MSDCGVRVGYLKVKGQIVFDSNCDCIRYTSEFRPVEKIEIDEILSDKLGPWTERFEKVLSEKGF